MIIGIGGVSRSGKTTLAGILEKEFNQQQRSANVLSLDDFAHPLDSLSKFRGVPDWERPESINWELLHQSINQASTEVLIIEGLFAFYPDSLRSLYDLKLFLTIERKTFTKRRIEETRWGAEPEWYPEHVWNSYLKYGIIPDDESEYLILDGNRPFDVEAILVPRIRSLR